MAEPVPLNKMSILSVGELLWDVIGSERHLGGAPFNFAYHCQAQGARSRILTRVGADEAGREAVAKVTQLGVSPVLIQTDPVHPTGMVDVTLRDGGEPSYQIRPNAAWDYLVFPDNARRAADCADILYFGTLAQRSPYARATILAVVACVPSSCLRVLDLNLRLPCPPISTLKTSLEVADVLKLNEGELDQLRDLLALPAGVAPAARELMMRYEIATVVVTNGAEGALALAADGLSYKSPGVPVTVKDTVGAGDAFTAWLVVQLASGASLEEALHLANAAGAYVASQAGGTPLMERAAVERLARAGVA